jgi:hypothetical protein
VEDCDCENQAEPLNDEQFQRLEKDDRMRRLVLMGSLFLVIAPHVYSQGIFEFYNPTAQTRIGSINGPLAGPGFWGQALVGVTADSLSPLGSPLEHSSLGTVGPSDLSVPGVFAGERVFVQLAAWNGMAWGTSLANVPTNQIGYTDIVSFLLASPTQPYPVPQFTQPAIIPAIPELSAFSLILFGGAILAFRCCHARKRRVRQHDAQAVHS